MILPPSVCHSLKFVRSFGKVNDTEDKNIDLNNTVTIWIFRRKIRNIRDQFFLTHENYENNKFNFWYLSLLQFSARLYSSVCRVAIMKISKTVHPPFDSQKFMYGEKKSRNRPRWNERWLRPVLSGGHAAVSHLFIWRCRPKNRVRFVLLQWVLKCRCRPVVCTFFGLELKWWGATDLKQVVRNLGSCLVCYSSCIVSRNTLGLVIAWTYFCPLYCCQSGLFFFPFFFSASRVAV